MTEDDGHAISYKLLGPGTPVVSADGVEIGTVARVLENEREHIFDGIVIATGAGERFLDAPEVGRIAERRVTATIDAAAAAGLPAPEDGPPEFHADPKAGRIRRLFGGGWKRR